MRHKAFLRQVQSEKIQTTGAIFVKERFCLYYEESARGGKMELVTGDHPPFISLIFTIYVVEFPR